MDIIFKVGDGAFKSIGYVYKAKYRETCKGGVI